MCNAGTASQSLDGNSVSTLLFNDGYLFGKPRRPSSYEVPKGEGVHSIALANLWIAGIVDGELRSAATTTGAAQFWPGSVQSEADCRAFDRIYRVTLADFVEYERSGIAAADLAEWPWQLGAPVVDGDGNPQNYHLAAGDRPQLVGDQTAWWIMNDAAGGAGEPDRTEPLGIEVRVTAMSISAARFVDVVRSSTRLGMALDLATLFRFDITYVGSASVEDLMVGMYVDTGLGDPTDDFVGSDSLLGLGFTYNGDDDDEVRWGGYGLDPPALGVKVIEGLRFGPDGLDNDRDGLIDEQNERLPLGTFMYFNNDNSVVGMPADAEERYGYMQARWRDGTPLTVGWNGYGGTRRTRFMYPAIPPAYWSEEEMGERNQPSDRRFLLAMGPVDMQPGEEQDFTLAILWARGRDRRHSLEVLKQTSRLAQLGFEMGDLAPGARWVDVSSRIHSQQLSHRSGLGKNHPNPFSGSTTIPFRMLESGHVRIAVYDVLGREVEVLVDGIRSAGSHEVIFDSVGFAPGVYTYRMSAFSGAVSLTMIIAK